MMKTSRLLFVLWMTLATGLDQKPPFSHEPLAVVLEKYVDAQGLMDYEALKRNHRPLDAYLRSLAQLDRETFDAWDEQKQIALLINAYNAFVMKTVVDHHPFKAGFFKSFKYPDNSIQHVGGVWSKRRHTLMGKKVSLDDIEHETLRKNYDEPRIHMALNCASMGCPPLRNEPYSGTKFDEQLDQQTKTFLSNTKKFRIDRKKKMVYLSPIFDWFGDDFLKTYTPDRGFPGQSKTHRAVLNFISQHLDEKNARFLRTESYTVEWLEYDWSLNEQ